jgi:hypothetical protein
VILYPHQHYKTCPACRGRWGPSFVVAGSLRPTPGGDLWAHHHTRMPNPHQHHQHHHRHVHHHHQLMRRRDLLPHLAAARGQQQHKNSSSSISGVSFTPPITWSDDAEGERPACRTRTWMKHGLASSSNAHTSIIVRRPDVLGQGRCIPRRLRANPAGVRGGNHEDVTRVIRTCAAAPR